MKKNLRARSKNKKLADFEEHLEKKGIKANLDSLRGRVKSRRSIGDLEGNQDKLAEKALKFDSDEDMEEERVGRKRKRSMSDSDEEMDDGEESKSRSKSNK